MTDTSQDQATLNLQEQIARIDDLLAAAAKAKVDTAWAPWQIITTTLGAGAALFAAGGAFVKLLLS